MYPPRGEDASGTTSKEIRIFVNFCEFLPLGLILWYTVRVVKIFPLFCLLSSTAFGALVEPLPAPEFADMEMSTNLPFEVSNENAFYKNENLSRMAATTVGRMMDFQGMMSFPRDERRRYGIIPIW